MLLNYLLIYRFIYQSWSCIHDYIVDFLLTKPIILSHSLSLVHTLFILQLLIKYDPMVTDCLNTAHKISAL